LSLFTVDWQRLWQVLYVSKSCVAWSWPPPAVLLLLLCLLCYPLCLNTPAALLRSAILCCVMLFLHALWRAEIIFLNGWRRKLFLGKRFVTLCCYAAAAAALLYERWWMSLPPPRRPFCCCCCVAPPPVVLLLLCSAAAAVIAAWYAAAAACAVVGVVVVVSLRLLFRG
jgi:hypothetical protein